MDKIKQKLDEELGQVQFSSERQVIEKLNRRSFKERSKEFLNKEIEIPLFPVMGFSIALVAIVSLYPIVNEMNQQTPLPNGNAPHQDKIIEKGGSFYWESSFKEVEKYES